MKKILAVSLILLSLCGCGLVRNSWVTLKQKTVMLNSEIVLYSYDGKVIQKWQTRANVVSEGGEAWWVNNDGVQHHISGTFIVEGR